MSLPLLSFGGDMSREHCPLGTAIIHIRALDAAIRQGLWSMWFRPGCQKTLLATKNKLFVANSQNIMQAWEEGGYSDDMTATAKCSQHRLRVVSPPSAVFVQRIRGQTGFAEHWGYLRRCAWLSQNCSAQCSRVRILSNLFTDMFADSARFELAYHSFQR